MRIEISISSSSSSSHPVLPLFTLLTYSPLILDISVFGYGFRKQAVVIKLPRQQSDEGFRDAIAVAKKMTKISKKAQKYINGCVPESMCIVSICSKRVERP